MVVDLDELLDRMTLEEKAAQLGAVWFLTLVDEDGRLDTERARRRLRSGIGHVTRIASETGLPAGAVSDLANKVQRLLVEETRLGIPAIIHEEAVGGVCAFGATQFPQGIGLASTWDPQLLERVAGVIREQLLAIGSRQALSPVLDIARDPRWGRLEETYGQDPYLASVMGIAYVRGLQTGDLREGVAATGKHFLGYGFPEGGLNHASAIVGPRLLRDVIAAPFRAAINGAGMASVMAAYNDVDGAPCHGSPEVLQDLLRDELGFCGVVVADYWGVQLLESWHAVAADGDEAAILALRAGMDLELPSSQAYRRLPALVEAGRIPTELVDRSVRRVLELKSQLGLFEQPYTEAHPSPAAAFDRAEHRTLARRAAEQSVVLCTNDGTLPLEPGTRVAVIGPTADEGRLALGDYHYPAHVELLHDTAMREESPTAGARRLLPPLRAVPIVTVVEGLRSLGFDVRHAPGCSVTEPDRSGFSAALEAAAEADVAVVCVGGRSGLTRSSTSGEFRDVSDLGLPGIQHELVEAALELGKPTVVVVISGRLHALPSITARASALVWAWLPGEEGGAGIARVVAGLVDATGRMPVSVPRSVGQVPVHHDHLSGAGRSQILGDYVDGPATPLFPFGHGCSFTSFAWSELEVGFDPASSWLVASLRVENVGHRSGTEVAQLYVRDEVATVSRPVRSLVGFARVDLEVGDSAVVSMRVDPDRLGFHDRDLRYRVEPGWFTVLAAASAGDDKLGARVELTGPVRYPDPNRLRPTETAIVRERKETSIDPPSSFGSTV